MGCLLAASCSTKVANGGSNTDNELSLNCCFLGDNNDGSNEEDGLSVICFFLDGGTDNELSIGYCLSIDNGGSGAEDCLLFVALPLPYP